MRKFFFRKKSVQTKKIKVKKTIKKMKLCFHNIHAVVVAISNI